MRPRPTLPTAWSATRSATQSSLQGLRFVADDALTLAVTGAGCAVRVDGRPRAFGEPVSVPAGAEVAVGPADTGVRSCVALAGGIAVAPVLGSRSTDTLAGSAHRWSATAPGSRWVPRDRAHRGRHVPTAAPRPGAQAARGTAGRLVHRRPLTVLNRTSYAVTADSNRIGLRLAGRALARQRVGELPSEGIVLGAVQVPPDGQPVVFLNDHPVTGGYSVVAVVDPRDLPVCAQARSGDRWSFELA